MRHFRASQHTTFKLPGTGRVWRGMILAAGLVLAGLLLLAGDKNLLKVIALYREQSRLGEEIEDLKAQNVKLQQQIEDLQNDPKAVERIAREEMGMVRKDERVYRFVPPASRDKARQ